MRSYEGRLELMWTNKGLRLLAHEDGSYKWVPPSDYQVAEVRLIEDIATVGEVGSERAADNLLIRGDALSALCVGRRCIALPCHDSWEAPLSGVGASHDLPRIAA